MKNLKKAALSVIVVAAACLATPLGGQNVVLKSDSDQNLAALLAARDRLLSYGADFQLLRTSTTPADSAAQQMLNDAASSGADYLRSITDLLGLYDNLRYSADRALMKPLLKDRLRLYSHLLGLAAAQSLPMTTQRNIRLGAVSVGANAYRAPMFIHDAQLYNELRAAKNRVDAAADSLE
jgi:hypothetical protein